jgi:hypothetical protein
VDIQGVQEGTEGAPLWGPSVQDQCGGGDCVVCGSVGKLEQVESLGEAGGDVVFKALHDDRSECSGSVVIQFSYFPFLRQGDNSGHLEVGGDNGMS